MFIYEASRVIIIVHILFTFIHNANRLLIWFLYEWCDIVNNCVN